MIILLRHPRHNSGARQTCGRHHVYATILRNKRRKALRGALITGIVRRVFAQGRDGRQDGMESPFRGGRWVVRVNTWCVGDLGVVTACLQPPGLSGVGWESPGIVPAIPGAARDSGLEEEA
jgi:hypothetical protein